VLLLFQSATAETVVLADKICTGLQLANFCQDVRVDWLKGRLYVPLDDCARFGYTEEDFESQNADRRFGS